MGFEVLAFPERSAAGSSTRSYLEFVNEANLLIHMPTYESPAVAEEVALAERSGIQVLPLLPTRVDPSTGLPTATAATRESRSGSRFAKYFSSLKELREEVRKALSDAMARRFGSPSTLTEWNADSYRGAARSVAYAFSRLAIVQSTSSLFLGPRADRVSQEEEFLRELDNLAVKLTGRKRPGISKNFKLTMLFNIDDTADVVDSVDYPDVAQRRDVFRNLYTKLDGKPGVVVAGVHTGVSPVIVYDNSFEMGTEVCGRRFYGRFPEYGHAATQMWDVFYTDARQGIQLGDLDGLVYPAQRRRRGQPGGR